jgi:hypothetical protein
MNKKLTDVLSFTLGFVFAAATACAALCHSALSAPVSVWAVFNSSNSELPNDFVRALALAADGSVWVGTGGGLAQLDKDGRLAGLR